MTHRYDTVLLDVDGTLIDSTYVHALAWLRAFRTVDARPAWFRVHRAIGMGGDRLVDHVLGPEVEERHGDLLRKRWEEEYAALVDDVPPIPGAAALIRELRDLGLRVALASSGAKRFTDDAMELLGVGDSDLDAVTTSGDADDSKPEPDILGIALERAGGERGILVGDTTWDVEAAGRSGMLCVAVLTGGFSEQELRDAGAVTVVDSVADLCSFDWQALSRG